MLSWVSAPNLPTPARLTIERQLLEAMPRSLLPGEMEASSTTIDDLKFKVVWTRRDAGDLHGRAELVS